jgi:hypothetical protein
LRRGSRISALVVGEHGFSTFLSAKPPVGARLDVGFAVVVVKTKDVAGGGVIVAGDRLDGASAVE